jgi:cytoskeletal protein CcmA (bactofilin family)
MFRRDKTSKLDNEGLRRMREAIRQRLEQEETAAPGAASTEQGYQPQAAGGTGGPGAYTYESLSTEPDYSYAGDAGRSEPAGATGSDAAPSGASTTNVPWAPGAAQTAPTGPDVAPAAPRPAVTTIAADATWSGTLRSTADVRIEGTLDGEVAAEGELHVAADAKVDATARAATMVVAGHLNGQVVCRDRLEILSSGHVSGQIQAGSIVVHEGAFIGGQLRMQGREAGESGETEQPRPMLQRVR